MCASPFVATARQPATGLDAKTSRVVQWLSHWTTSGALMTSPIPRDPIPRDTVVDSLVDRLRDDVLSGRYPPGSYLPPERELAAGYEVTRTSLKHAIVRLAQAGLLETRHGVGTRVRDYERLGGRSEEHTSELQSREN